MQRELLHFVAFLGLVVTMFDGPAFADEQTKPRQGTAPAPRQESAASPAEIQISGGYIGTWYTEADDETRLLLLRVTVKNRHNQSIAIPPEAWKLTAEDRERSAIPVPTEVAGVTVSVNGERVEFKDVKTDTLNLKPDGDAATWLLFKNLPDGNRIPQMSLACEIPGGAVVKVDVDETFARRLKLDSRLVGPANAVALLTINGTLDTINAGKLAQKIDEISATRIRRIIVEFGPDAQAPDHKVAGWLRTVAMQSGRAPIVNEDFPSLATSIVDFHVVHHRTAANSAAHDSLHSTIRRLSLNESGRSGATRNVHAESIAAVDSAAIPLCEMLPREELLRSVRQGDSATKAAVLRHTAERLSTTNLPLILSLTEDENLNVSTAAIYALRTSGKASATAKLMEIARSREHDPGAVAKSASEIRRTVAIHSLAASKYATSHPKIISLLSTSDEFVVSETARAISLHPRPAWSEPLATLISESSAKTQVHLVPALAAVGHPRLLTILERCLTSTERQLSATALNLLIARNDPVAEQLTSQWMLKSLATASPSPVLLSFLRKTRDHRAIPMLLRHLGEKQTDRHELLSTILTIGDHRIAEQIAADFEKYDFTEQLLILRALSEVHSPKFWTLISSVNSKIKTSDDKMLEGVVSLLRQDGSDRAVNVLSKILEKLLSDPKRSQRHLAVVCSALAGAGTPDARDALREAAHHSELKSTIPRQSLLQLYQRSPAYRYALQGANYVRIAVKHSEAGDHGDARHAITRAMTLLNAAVKVDPDHPDSRHWRANAALHMEQPSVKQLETARQDFARFVELEPDNSEGHTGLALVLVRQGDIKAGLEAGKVIGEKSKDDSVYLYNMACIYGRAIEQLETRSNPQNPDQKKQIEKYRSEGVKLLQQSIDNGLNDSNLDWMQRDPDLETIRQSPAFAELVEKTLGSGEENLPGQKPQRPE